MYGDGENLKQEFRLSELFCFRPSEGFANELDPLKPREAHLALNISASFHVGQRQKMSCDLALAV